MKAILKLPDVEIEVSSGGTYPYIEMRMDKDLISDEWETGVASTLLKPEDVNDLYLILKGIKERNDYEEGRNG